MKRSYDYYLTNIQSLSIHEYRTFNRYFLHPNNERCCTKCKQIFTNIKENFHIKKYDDNQNISWNVHCKQCVNADARKRMDEYRLDPFKFISTKINGFRHRAKEKGVSFDVSAKYLHDLFIEQNMKCFYTNTPLDFSKTSEINNKPHNLTPSLDRLDPNKGYVKGNVVWCIYEINRMKNEFDFEKFIQICGNIYNKFKQSDVS